MASDGETGRVGRGGRMSRSLSKTSVVAASWVSNGVSDGLSSARQQVSGRSKQGQLLSRAERTVRRAGKSVHDSSWSHQSNYDDTWNAEERLSHATTTQALQNLVQYTESAIARDIQQVGARKHQLMRVILDDESQRRTCITFPMIVLYFAMFTAVFQLHFGTPYINLQESPLRAALVDDAQAVTTQQDIFQWMEGTLFPYLWSCPNVDGNGGRPSTAFTSAEQELIGGVMIRTTRGKVERCTSPLSAGRDCFPEAPNVRAGDPVFNGWDADSRRLRTVRDGNAGLGHRLSRFALGRASPEPARRRGRRLEAKRVAGEGRGGRAPRAPGPQRPSFVGHIAAKRAEKAERRRLERLNAHMRDSVPDFWTMGKVYKYAMPISMTLDQVTDVLRVWKRPDARLLTNTTTALNLVFALRNSALDNGVVTVGYFTFSFSRGGNIYVQALLNTLVLKTRTMVLAGLVLWGILLMVLTVLAGSALMQAVQEGDCCAYLGKFSNLWEWMTLVCGWLIMALIVAERLGTSKFNQQWEEYQELRDSIGRTIIRDFDRSWFSKMEANLYQATTIDGFIQLVVSFYHIALIFRFIIASQGHPRLAIAVRTLEDGMKDLAHLFVVFVIIFISFVMAGHILFGNRMPDFATIKGSLGYCVHIVLQREYDYNDLTQEDPMTASFWIVCFMLLVVLVVVNIVLAMIFDNYGQVRMMITDKDTIWHTARYLLKRMRNVRGWASNQDLLIALGKVGSNEMVTAKRFRELCPGIQKDQVEHLYDVAKLRLVTAVIKGNKNILSESMASILLSVEDLRRGMANMGSPPSQPGRLSTGGSTVGAYPSGRRASDDAIAEVKAADEVEEKVAEADTPPDVAPAWVAEGLLRHLRSRQTAMDHLFLQMNNLQEHMRARGVSSTVPLPIQEPVQPSRDGSRRLDPTLTGKDMGQRITPGAGRQELVSRTIRGSCTRSGPTAIERLGRA